MEQKYIKYVALYLRKSRGDAEIDLEKHKKVLIEMCIQNGWKYVEYEEIGSGDSIHVRPIFQKLLIDIENGIFDAVCVVDIDRLGRGDMGDQDKIKKAFAKTNTYVITPQQIYNLNNDDDEFVVDMKSFIARREYKQIVKRLIQGKKVGARMGQWTNGTPPYPYEYERWGDKYNEKGLVVNDDKLKIYRFMINSVINEGKTPTEIAWQLNKRGIPSPRNGIWHNVTVSRILHDETHLGKIITNKTKGDGHKKKKPDALEITKIPKNQWIVVENCHEPVKTQEEHEKIMLFASRLTKIQKRKPITIKPLTGLIKCGLCGHTMSITIIEGRKNSESLKACWFADSVGNKCMNRGMTTNIIYDYINSEILKYKQELKDKIKNADVNLDKINIDGKIYQLEQDLSNKEKSLCRILDAFENGVYSLKQFKERKEKIESVIEEIKNQTQLLKIEQRQFNIDTIKDKYKLIERFENEIQGDKISDKEKNQLYKSIIDSITWTRIENNITIEVKFK